MKIRVLHPLNPIKGVEAPHHDPQALSRFGAFSPPLPSPCIAAVVPQVAAID
jgi:hypothetical protein